MAMRCSVQTPAFAFFDNPGVGRFNGSAGSLPLICSGSQNFLRQCAAKRLSFSGRSTSDFRSPRRSLEIIRCEGSAGNQSELPSPPEPPSKASFGYSRKDVLLIGVGVCVLGVGLKSGLEYIGVDPLLAGNYVQLIVVLGMTVGWISTYMFRVANKDMTYAQQLRDYERKVMEKRLDGLSEAELEALMEQVEEEKRQLAGGEKPKSKP
ncbi:uncharacterized protein LOC144708636 [Wolffia australiana]